MAKLTAVLLLLLVASAEAGDDRDILYQVSTIDALLAGIDEPMAELGEV
jgi:hypothetical protein